MTDFQEIIQRLVPGLTNIFGSAIDRIILYGSVARGTDTEESDMDIAVIVHGYTESMHEQMTELAVDLELEYGRVLSIMLIDYRSFTEWENVMPFYKNVKKDGIVLWQAV